MTPGSDGQTLDGISMKMFENLIEELSTEKFKFTTVKRVYIPKKNGSMRPLGIPNTRDNIFQLAILMVLELIYEPQLSELSFGFRPNRSTHSALSLR
jgi:retron-type reverse transcriptase